MLQLTKQKHWYYLMNQNIELVKFCIQSELPLLVVDKVYEYLPTWLNINTLCSFIRNRMMYRNYDNMFELYKLSDCLSVDNYVQTT